MSPQPGEREACLLWLYRQIELIDPSIVILLGATALKSLAGTWMEWNGRLAMPVYHPSALLRNPDLKRDTWSDFKKIVYKYRELVDASHAAPHC